MDYKTILVHCNDIAHLPRLLEPAMALGDLFKVHVIGLSVTPPVRIIAAGMPGAPDTIVLDEHCHTYRAQNPLMTMVVITPSFAPKMMSGRYRPTLSRMSASLLSPVQRGAYSERTGLIADDTPDTPVTRAP